MPLCFQQKKKEKTKPQTLKKTKERIKICRLSLFSFFYFFLVFIVRLRLFFFIFFWCLRYDFVVFSLFRHRVGAVRAGAYQVAARLRLAAPWLLVLEYCYFIALGYGFCRSPVVLAFCQICNKLIIV